MSERRLQHNEGRAVKFPLPVPNFWRLKLGEALECSTGVYLKRWYLETPFFSLRLHHWLSSDDSRNLHDHPWNFITIVLWNSYLDVVENGSEEVKLLRPKYRNASHKHRVVVSPSGCWSLLLTSGRYRRWGFWIKDKFMKANKYFLTFGSHPCN